MAVSISTYMYMHTDLMLWCWYLSACWCCVVGVDGDCVGVDEHRRGLVSRTRTVGVDVHFDGHARGLGIGLGVGLEFRCGLTWQEEWALLADAEKPASEKTRLQRWKHEPEEKEEAEAGRQAQAPVQSIRPHEGHEVRRVLAIWIATRGIFLTAKHGKGSFFVGSNGDGASVVQRVVVLIFSGCAQEIFKPRTWWLIVHLIVVASTFSAQEAGASAHQSCAQKNVLSTHGTPWTWCRWRRFLLRRLMLVHSEAARQKKVSTTNMLVHFWLDRCCINFFCAAALCLCVYKPSAGKDDMHGNCLSRRTHNYLQRSVWIPKVAEFWITGTQANICHSCRVGHVDSTGPLLHMYVYGWSLALCISGWRYMWAHVGVRVGCATEVSCGCERSCSYRCTCFFGCRCDCECAPDVSVDVHVVVDVKVALRCGMCENR